MIWLKSFCASTVRNRWVLLRSSPPSLVRADPGRAPRGWRGRFFSFEILVRFKSSPFPRRCVFLRRRKGLFDARHVHSSPDFLSLRSPHLVFWNSSPDCGFLFLRSPYEAGAFAPFRSISNVRTESPLKFSGGLLIACIRSCSWSDCLFRFFSFTECSHSHHMIAF